MNIIQTNNLTNKLADTVAVDNVSLHIREDEIYGFWGLNEAGKVRLS